MIRKYFFIFVLFLILHGSAAAGIGPIREIPKDPIAYNYVSVEVQLGWPDCCYSLSAQFCEIEEGNNLILIDLYTDLFSGPCCDMATGTTVTCSYGLLSPGRYTVEVTEHITSDTAPATYTATHEFDVIFPISSGRDSWGKIKSIYR